jgi:DNA helicase-2/ATP-dependent DNA helicase PcrA
MSVYKTSSLELEQFSANIDKDIFKECYEYYEEYKKNNNLKDFDDLQLECMNLFLERPEILEGYRKLFKYVLVDEFQDSDGIQIEILRMLNENNSLFAVGDEDQCIYGFRGSRPDCMVDFEKHFTGGEKIFLSNNYRSPQNIVKASLELIKNNKMRNSKEINPVKNDEKKVDIINCINESSQADQIAENILKLREISNYKYVDNAVLYRTNLESRSIIDSFIRKSIPFKLLDKEYNFFEHFICKDILAYLKLSINSTDKDSFFRIINKPFRYVSKINLEKIRSNIKVDDCFEMLKNIDNIHPFQMKAIDRLRKDIQKLNKYSLRSAVDLVIMDLGYHDHIREYSRKYKIDISELEDIIDEFREACDGYNSIILFLAHVEEVKEQIKSNKNNNAKNKDAVILSTIHGVKGMEFKNVFIVNCNEDYIPHANSVENNLEEERRLFYVAVTRTIDNLWISMCKSIKGKMMKPSRFISELMLKDYNDENNPFKVGEKISHKSFGSGKVIYIDDKNIDIEFDSGIQRKFDAVITYNNNLITKC